MPMAKMAQNGPPKNLISQHKLFSKLQELPHSVRLQGDTAWYGQSSLQHAEVREPPTCRELRWTFLVIRECESTLFIGISMAKMASGSSYINYVHT